MASALHRLWNTSRFTERLCTIARFSSGLSSIPQKTCYFPAALLETKPTGLNLGCKASPQNYENVTSNLSACCSDLERRAPSMVPLGRKRFDLPTNPVHVSLEMPTVKSLLDKFQITPDCIKIEAPQGAPIVEKKAHRMIVIRRRKMKKHQLRKFRKKFRVLILSRKQKRNSEKETAFLNEILSKMVKADSFNAKAYVDMKLKQAYEPLPVKPKLQRPLPWEFQPLFAMSKKKD